MEEKGDRPVAEKAEPRRMSLGQNSNDTASYINDDKSQQTVLGGSLQVFCQFLPHFLYF